MSPPACSISLTSGSSLAPSRRPANTVKPSEANFFAISLPIKSPAPITATVAFLFCKGLLPVRHGSGGRAKFKPWIIHTVLKPNCQFEQVFALFMSSETRCLAISTDLEWCPNQRLPNDIRAEAAGGAEIWNEMG